MTALRNLTRSTAVLLFVAAVTGSASAQVSIGGNPAGTTLSLYSSGNWDLQASVPGWTFGGNVGGKASGVIAGSGSDAAGSYEEIDFTAQTPGGARSGYIRAYSGQPVVLFSETVMSDSPNTVPFTSISNFPSGLFHLTYSGSFSLPDFNALGPDSPWIWFDSSANTFVVSAADDFMIASMTTSASGSIQSGINSAIPMLPAGLTHRTVLAYGAGIDSTIRSWGRFLISLSGKQAPANDADALLRQVSYWTDNTATYYYNPGGPSYTGTLQSIQAEFTSKGIALGSMQLDSWWYPKAPDNSWSSSGGIWSYDADPSLFPDGLASLQTSLGIPLITHARWIDAASPYRTQYAMSGNVAVDPAWWEMVASNLQSAGVKTFEQDWLGANAHTDVNLADPAAFMDNMAAAMARHGLTMQYCMGEPKHFLQSTLYNNATTARTSQDGFSRARWTEFLYSGRFASAVGLWPFTDVFKSTDTNNLILAVLSAGPVGVGDAAGSLSRANLLKAARPDGVIVKPDVPATPLDSVYIADAQGIDLPMVAAASSQYGGSRVSFVFAYARQTNDSITISPAQLGIAGAAYLYDYMAESGSLIPAGQSWTGTLANKVGYFVLVPVGRTGIAFLGDKGQFATLGKKRIPSFADQGRLDATVSFAAGEKSRTLFGFSPQPVAATALAGSVTAVAWDPTTELFTLNVHPAQNGTAHVRIVQSFSGSNQSAAAGGCSRRCVGSPGNPR